MCQGIGTIIVQTAADPNSQYTWAFPDGSTISGNVSNGRDKLTLENIEPSMSGIYRVTVVDDNLCELYDEIDITILASDDPECLSNLSFSNLFPIQCSTDELPLMDDNGITGSWSPGSVLEQFAGQTLTFRFIPDDPTVAPEDFLITVEDLSDFPNFATEPAEIPILCNASDTTFDFIEMFQMNYNDFRLVVSGDLDLFDFIPTNTIGVVNSFVDEFRSIDVRGVSPRTVGFQIDALADCGADPITKSFFVTIIDDVDPIRIDTALCEGDFFEIGGYKIFQDTVIVSDYACDTMLVAEIQKLRPQTTVRFEAISAACGEGIYYYDTIVGGNYIGFVKSPLVNAPPYGPNYDTLFTETFLGEYVLPLPASNGCDSIQKVSFSIGRSSIQQIEFDLCSNKDTVIQIGNNSYDINKDVPYRYIPVSGCDFVEISANILPAIADSLPPATYCASEVVSVEISPGTFMDFDTSFTYPYTVELAQGANGCPATLFIDFTFIQPTRSTLNRRICPGESFTIGNVTFDQAVTDQEVTLVGASETGCDSIVTVTVTVVEPQNIDINETICEEDSYTVEGEVFDFVNPNGTVVVPSTLGCDSLIYDVQLSFFQVNDTIIAPVICPGDEIFLPEYNYTIDIDNMTADLVGSTADGCAQNVLIRATIDEPIRTSFDLSICDGDSYSFGGADLTAPGAYHDTLTAASGCDSISTLNLSLYPPLPTMNDGILSECQGRPVVHLGKSYFQEGDYTDTLQNKNGCDSIVTFSVRFDPVIRNDIGVMNICPDEILDFLGKNYDQEGIYEDTLQTTLGCDSIVQFEVDFYEIITDDIGILYTCPDQPLDFLGQSYDAEGSYSQTLDSKNGCDSIVQFEVAFYDVPTTDIGILNTCPEQPLDFLGQSYDTEGNYSVTLTSGDGCDSIVSFELVYYSIPTTDIGVLNTCPDESLFFNGEEFTAEGNYSSTFTSADGCDSIVSFELVYYPIPTTDIGILYTCPDEPLTFEGESFDSEGIHSVTLQSADGCDSIVTFELDFFDIPNTDIGVLTSCPQVPVIFLGKTYDSPGTYSDVLESADGCDSIVTFEVQFEDLPVTEEFVTICPGEQHFVFNNAYALEIDTVITIPGGSSIGCDTSVHLILTYVSPLESDQSFTICQGESFTFGGQTFDAAVTNVPVIFTSKEDCDSIVNVTVNVLPTYDIDLGDVQICGQGSHIQGDTTLTEEGPHVLQYMTNMGCDSIVRLNIVRVAEFSESISETLCPGTSTVINGTTYDASGTYMDSLMTDEGCDSILTINIEVLEPLDTTFMPMEQICFGTSYDFNGVNYTASGAYVLNFQSVEGCDSVVVMNLEVQEEITSTVNATTCSNEPYIFEGQPYSETGVYSVVYPSIDGCDSTIVLDLEVLQSFEVDLGTRQICIGGSLDIGGFILDQEDTYMLPFITADGCDSIVTVAIEIVENIEVDLGTVVICEGDAFSFGGNSITQSGTYSTTEPSAIGCDSTTTINIEVTPAMVVSITELIGSCEGVANGSFILEDIPGATPPFSISGLPGVDVVDALPFSVLGLEPGTYMFDVIDANGCMTEAEVEIPSGRDNGLMIRVVEIDPRGMYDLFIEYDGVIESIEWEDRDGLSCYDCPNPSVDITETTTFSVTVIDEDGCISRAEITLEPDAVGNVYFPNIISPNSALGNHRFFPQTESKSAGAHYDVFIYDRWGNMVYEMLNAPVNDISFGWNGRYSDNRINAGVFVYSVRIYKENGIVETFKGDLTVVE